MRSGGQYGYLAVLAAALVIGVAASLTPLAVQIDNDGYDWVFRLHPPERWETRSVLLTIDEASLLKLGGVRKIRSMLADGLERVAEAGPRAVAIDLTLADEGDPDEDARLENVLARAPNLVLAADLMPGGSEWQEPLARFARHAAAVGHVHAAQDALDAVNRAIPLEKAAGRDRRWALALEAWRLYAGGGRIEESPRDLRVGEVTIAAARENARAMLVRYLPPGGDGAPSIPQVSFRELAESPELAERFRGRAVFVGVTAQSMARDRLMTPYSFSTPMPGVEIHAHAFETIAARRFLENAPAWMVLGICLLLTAAAAAIFALRSGGQAYALSAVVLAAAHLLPHLFFRQGVVFPYFAPVSVAWLSLIGAGSYQHFVVRRQLRKSESDRMRYQQAIQFVTHEMRTPLTAIQGSSELIGRYNLNEEKRKEMAQMINSESKRLARMIQTFLDVERLTDGQVELKREPFGLDELVDACVQRARPLAERKQIAMISEEVPKTVIEGDRELMEYAVYNLLTNAVKYSPSETEIRVRGERSGGRVRLSVEDQGIGMDEKELRNIFRKFYRTNGAVASGEAGTGIGLSIVDQIVSRHGGTIEVSSSPGKGSCFTMVLPVREVRAAAGGSVSQG